MRALLEGIVTIAKVSPYRKKYAHLLNKLVAAQLIDPSGDVPSSVEDRLRVMYIQPRILAGDDPEQVVDFARLASAIRTSFPADGFMKRFSDSLELWGED